MPRTEIFTYFTRATGRTILLYSAEEWVRVRMRLRDAGPVAIGTKQDLGTVLTGTGILLETDSEEEFILPKGERVYVLSESVNRVSFKVEPIPWLSQILAAVTGGFRSLLTGKEQPMHPDAPPQAPPPKRPTDPRQPTKIERANLGPYQGRTRGAGRRRR